MTDDEALHLANAIITRHILFARSMTEYDYSVVRRVIRIAQFLPEGGHRYMKEFRSIHDRYGFWVCNYRGDFENFRDSVLEDLLTHPLTEEESTTISEIVIKMAARID